MFNPFVWLDSILLGAAQKFCDKVQRLTGLTKFTFQKFSAIMFVMFLWAVFFEECLSGRIDHVEAMVLSMLSMALVWLVFLIERQEKEFLKCRALQSTMFHDRIMRIFWVLPYVCLGILALFYGNPKTALADVSYILFAYFSACIPQPPSKSKMREWLSKGLWWLHDILEPSPVPIPITGR